MKKLVFLLLFLSSFSHAQVTGGVQTWLGTSSSYRSPGYGLLWDGTAKAWKVDTTALKLVFRGGGVPDTITGNHTATGTWTFDRTGDANGNDMIFIQDNSFGGDIIYISAVDTARADSNFERVYQAFTYSNTAEGGKYIGTRNVTTGDQSPGSKGVVVSNFNHANGGHTQIANLNVTGSYSPDLLPDDGLNYAEYSIGNSRNTQNLRTGSLSVDTAIVGKIRATDSWRWANSDDSAGYPMIWITDNSTEDGTAMLIEHASVKPDANGGGAIVGSMTGNDTTNNAQYGISGASSTNPYFPSNAHKGVRTGGIFSGTSGKQAFGSINIAASGITNVGVFGAAGSIDYSDYPNDGNNYAGYFKGSVAITDTLKFGQTIRSGTPIPDKYITIQVGGVSYDVPLKAH